MNISILKLATGRKIGVRRWTVSGYSNGVVFTTPSRNHSGWFAASIPDRPDFWRGHV